MALFGGGVALFGGGVVLFGGGVAQLVSARLSEQEVFSLILDDFNVCFGITLIRVAIALNTRKTKH